MMLIIVIGFPCLLFFFVRNKEKDIRNSAVVHANLAPKFVTAFAYFIKGYKSDRKYWELVVIMRKILLSFIVVSLDGALLLQMNCVTAVLFCSYALHARFRYGAIQCV